MSKEELTQADYKKIASAITKSIRGKQSQSKLSASLSKNHNLLYKIESGKRVIYWEEFTALCKLLNFPLKNVLAQTRIFTEDLTAKEVILSNHLHMNSAKAAKCLKINLFTYNRMISGQKRLTLDIFLMILDRLQFSLFDFLGHFPESKEIEKYIDLVERPLFK